MSDAPRTDAKKAAFCQIEMPRLLKLVWEWAENLEGEIREDMEMLNEELRTNATLRQQLAAVTAERDALRGKLHCAESCLSEIRALMPKEWECYELPFCVVMLIQERDALRKSLSSVDEELSMLESTLHGVEGDHVTEIRKITSSVKRGRP